MESVRTYLLLYRSKKKIHVCFPVSIYSHSHTHVYTHTHIAYTSLRQCSTLGTKSHNTAVSKICTCCNCSRHQMKYFSLTDLTLLLSVSMETTETLEKVYFTDVHILDFTFNDFYLFCVLICRNELSRS